MSDFEIVSKDAEIDECYGHEAFYITKEEITALLSGKKLYSIVNCGEYAITIEMAEDVVIKRSLCDSCVTKGCIFQSGIVRSHCDFYKTESEDKNDI